MANRPLSEADLRDREAAKEDAHVRVSDSTGRVGRFSHRAERAKAIEADLSATADAALSLQLKGMRRKSDFLALSPEERRAVNTAKELSIPALRGEAKIPARKRPMKAAKNRPPVTSNAVNSRMEGKGYGSATAAVKSNPATASVSLQRRLGEILDTVETFVSGRVSARADKDARHGIRFADLPASTVNADILILIREGKSICKRRDDWIQGEDSAFARLSRAENRIRSYQYLQRAQ